MAQNKLPRRAVLSGIVAALLWSGLPAYALTKSAAKILINQAVDDINAMVASTDDEEIMGVRHKTLPIEGVQFHPESVLTEHGHDLLNNFLKAYG